MRMNKINSLYEVPTINIFEVRLEGAILTGSDELNPKSWTAGQSDWFEDYDD